MNKDVIDLSNTLWNYHRLKLECSSCDLILGLGSYDLRVADHCADLYLKKVASKILFSGALGNWTRDMWDQPEAEVFKKRAITLGVPEKDILLEFQATNLGENLIFSRQILEEKRIETKGIVLVTKPNTLRRAYATAKKVWAEKEFFTDCPGFEFSEQATENRSNAEIIDEMVGDIERILEYPELGYQIKQEIPAEVIEAYEKLVALGFTSHMAGKK